MNALECGLLTLSACHKVPPKSRLPANSLAQLAWLWNSQHSSLRAFLTPLLVRDQEKTLSSAVGLTSSPALSSHLGTAKPSQQALAAIRRTNVRRNTSAMQPEASSCGARDSTLDTAICRGARLPMPLSSSGWEQLWERWVSPLRREVFCRGASAAALAIWAGPSPAARPVCVQSYAHCRRLPGLPACHARRLLPTCSQNQGPRAAQQGQG